MSNPVDSGVQDEQRERCHMASGQMQARPSVGNKNSLPRVLYARYTLWYSLAIKR